MKTLTGIFVTAALFLAACSTTHQTSVPYDDVYYSPKDNPTVTVAPKPVQTTDNKPVPVQSGTPVNPSQQNYQYQGESTEYSSNEYVPQDYQDQPSYSNSETYTDPDGSTVINNNYYYGGYDTDDYYDYYYSSRLRRFHHPFSYNNYWDDYYTNLYWYSYDPWDWGCSIYYGYNWLWPSWYYHYGYYNSWYYPYSYYGMGYGWGYPYYGWGSPYYMGYYDGYWDGYWAGDYYYNSNDDNTYYGPREPRSSNSGHGRPGRSNNHSENSSFGERYEKAIALNPVNTEKDIQNDDIRTYQTSGIEQYTTPPVTNTGRNDQVKPTEKSNQSDNRVKNESVRVNAEPRNPVQDPKKVNNNPPQKNTGDGKVIYNPGKATQVYPSEKSTYNQQSKPGTVQKNDAGTRKPVQQPTNQYPKKDGTKPATDNTRKEYKAPSQERYTKPKTYYSPNYTKPKSSQEYVSPKTESMPKPDKIRDNSKATYSRPDQSNHGTYNTQPRKENNNTPSYQNESRSSDRSSGRSESSGRGSYSAPSSSGSSSSGSRSSGSGSGGSSSGGSSRGRR